MRMLGTPARPTVSCPRRRCAARRTSAYYRDLAPGGARRPVAAEPRHLNITGRVPIGPVGVITPWNTPFMLSTWKIAPALAAGCTIVHKPAEFSPVTARLLAEIAHEAGLPAGVWNLVNGFGETTGKALTEQPDIKAIAFVGESRTGSMIMKQGADTLKRCHFELGGKNPVVVFDDADLERALDAAIFMIYSLNGERCTSSSRLLVHDTIADEFEEKLAARVNRIRIGNPLDPATELGPLIHRSHFDKVTGYFDIAREDGATIAAGGEAVSGKGWYVKPTLFTGARQSMRIARERKSSAPCSPPSAFRPRRRRCRSPTMSTTVWRAMSGPTTSPAPCAFAMRWRPA